LVALVFLGNIMRVAVPFTGILTPKIVIDEITSEASAGHFLAVMGVMAGVWVAVYFLKGWTDNVIEQNVFTVADNLFTKQSTEKLLSMDYEAKETAFFNRCFYRGSMNERNHMNSACFLRIISGIGVSLMRIVLYGSLAILIHPAVLLLIAIGAVLNGIMAIYIQKFNRARWDKHALWKIEQMLSYVGGIYGNKQNAKDIRIYGIIPWINKRYDHYMQLRLNSELTLTIRNLATSLVNGLMILIQNGAAYYFLVGMLLKDAIGLGDFVMMFAAVGTLGGRIRSAIQEIDMLLHSSLELNYRREMLNFPDSSNTSLGVPLPPKDAGPEISMEGVSYNYPIYELQGEGKIVVMESYTSIENVNVTINPGERIAIVGANGAGKTTLVKLICGLYKPTTGRITVAGQDIQAYNRDEYFTLLTAVFQDIHLLPETIIENVSQKPLEQTDRNRAEACLMQAGLGDKISSLPKGADTLLVREVYKDATELSGGERQKLALARALYKDAPILILDEPTAALDPIAEDEVYQQYAAMTQGRTSIYISHRLASTRFCDRILYMENKTITEIGSHEELMEKGGKYAEMYTVQASYYQED
jgi:ATP-binding cassette subfamily B protein